MRKVITVFTPSNNELEDDFVGIFDTYEELEEKLSVNNNVYTIINPKFLRKKLPDGSNRRYQSKGKTIYSCFESFIKDDD